MNGSLLALLAALLTFHPTPVQAQAPVPQSHQTVIAFCDDVPKQVRANITESFATARRELPDPGNVYPMVCSDITKFTSKYWPEGVVAYTLRPEGHPSIELYAEAFEKNLKDPYSAEIVPHEYYHLVQMSLSRENFGHAPLWLREGSAEYTAFRMLDRIGKYKYSNARTRKLGPAITAFKNGSTLRVLEGMNGRFLDTYTLGFFAVEMLAAKSGEASTTKFWTRLGTNGSWQQAFQQTFGLSVDAFYAQFDDWAKKGFEPQLKPKQ